MDQTISLAEVRTMFGLPPASALELPDPEEHGRSLLHRAAHAGSPNLCKALLELGADHRVVGTGDDLEGKTRLERSRRRERTSEARSLPPRFRGSEDPRVVQKNAGDSLPQRRCCNGGAA